MSVAIIDYGSGNLHSAAKAFERTERESWPYVLWSFVRLIRYVAQDQPIVVTSDPEIVRTADRVVLPGVGAFADCKSGLLAVDGMMDALNEAVREKGRPFLGICVGMQLLADRGLEHGVTGGFGWIGGEVRAIEPDDETLKIPHMGWNTLELVNPHPLLDGIETGAQGLHAYFVHSYHLAATDRNDIVAETDYGGRVTAAVARGNLAGTQFHPEKSQSLGLRLIANFLKWKP